VTETERYAKMNAAARDALSREVHRQRLIGGVERLPSRQQVALHLSLLDGLTDEEIAQAMRTTPADVVTLLNLAYSQLRRTV
jgi:DNA-directed RNA polymerase specialized sigma24 family protein